MITGIIIGAVLAFLILWAISVRRSLAVMEENINNTMMQISVQISSQFDALTALLELTKGYAAHESQALTEALRSRRAAITAASAPEDVLKQERLISETLERLSMVAERSPELKANEVYGKCVAAVESYGKMVYTSCLIYNDGVAKLNHELRRFPTSLLGRLLGFHQRAYLNAAEDVPGVK